MRRGVIEESDEVLAHALENARRLGLARSPVGARSRQAAFAMG
jgi:hypothetical protein